MANYKTDPDLMKLADQIFWEEFNQAEKPVNRYIVIDSKNDKVVAQNAKLVSEKKKVRV